MVFVTGNGTPTEGFIIGIMALPQGFVGGVDTQNTSMKLYDEGALNSRTITADNGAVLIQGNDGSKTQELWIGSYLSIVRSRYPNVFHPRKAAFRAGNVTATQWNDANIGDYSVAMDVLPLPQEPIWCGYWFWFHCFRNLFNGNGLGQYGFWRAYYSFSLGQNSTASGWSSTALGRVSTASGSQSMVFGHGLTVSGANSYWYWK